MSNVSIIRIDLAENMYQLHGAGCDGSVVFRKKLSRSKLLPFLASLPPCTVAAEPAPARTFGAARSARLGMRSG